LHWQFPRLAAHGLGPLTGAVRAAAKVGLVAL
jgi:hypothetical protein